MAFFNFHHEKNENAKKYDYYLFINISLFFFILLFDTVCCREDHPGVDQRSPTIVVFIFFTVDGSVPGPRPRGYGGTVKDASDADWPSGNSIAFYTLGACKRKARCSDSRMVMEEFFLNLNGNQNLNDFVLLPWYGKIFDNNLCIRTLRWVRVIVLKNNVLMNFYFSSSNSLLKDNWKDSFFTFST